MTPLYDAFSNPWDIFPDERSAGTAANEAEAAYLGVVNAEKRKAEQDKKDKFIDNNGLNTNFYGK